MNKIQQIQLAIDNANLFKSKLSDECKNVPFLGSLKIRALLNHIGAIGEHFLEVGSHKSGSFCSTIYGNENLKSITAIDSWDSDANSEDKAYPQFISNTNKFKPQNAKLNVIIGDCFSIDLRKIKNKIDIFGYDAGHSYTDQRDALIYYKPILADEFIYLCDDWTYGDVKMGTLAGIKEGGYEVLFSAELENETKGEDLHLNDEWWRGYGVFLLKKTN